MAADSERTQRTEMQQRLLELLGERDPMSVLAETPDRLDVIVRTHALAELRARPRTGRWTPNEILGHLVEHEHVMAVRIRVSRFEDEPLLPGYDQERWVAGQGHDAIDPRVHVRRFRLLREANLEQWSQLRGEEWGRVGRHGGRGPETLELMRRLHAGHDLAHLDQIGRYLMEGE